MRKQIYFIIVLIPFFVACSRQKIPNKVLITPVASLDCKKSDSVSYFYSHYQGEKIDVEYTPIAMITAVNGNCEIDDMFFKLKQGALTQCADGIINLSQNYRSGVYKNENLLYDPYSSYRIQYNNFDQLIYTGLAVQFKTAPNQDLRNDTAFVNRQNQYAYDKKMGYLKDKSIAKKDNSPSILFGIVAFLAVFGLYFGYVKHL